MDSKTRKKNGNHEQKEEKKFHLSKMKLEKIINDHTGYVVSLCLLEDRRLASSSWDKTIKVFNLETYECEIIIKENIDTVRSINLLPNGYLVSSSSNQIKIWEIKKRFYQCIKTICVGNFEILRVVGISNGRLCSSSTEKTVQVWKASSPYCFITKLNGHTNYACSVIELKNKKYIVSAGHDETIFFWNSSTYKCEKALENIGYYSHNSLLEIKEDKIIFGAYKEIRIINVLTFQVESILIIKSFRNALSFYQFEDGSILCGCFQGKLLYFSYREFKIWESKEKAHDNNINSLFVVDNSLVITCSDDFSIRVWRY